MGCVPLCHTRYAVGAAAKWGVCLGSARPGLPNYCHLDKSLPRAFIRGLFHTCDVGSDAVQDVGVLVARCPGSVSYTLHLFLSLGLIYLAVLPVIASNRFIRP